VNFAGGTYGSRVHDGGESSTTNISGEEIGSSNGYGSKRRSELVITNTTLRPDGRELAAKQPRIDGWKPHFWPTNISPRVLKNASTSAPASNSNSSPEEDAELREWKEELEKIEKKSRKSSDLLGFFKRKRSEGAL
jgi:hypothetical protein